VMNHAVGDRRIVVVIENYMGFPRHFRRRACRARSNRREFGIEILLLRETIGRKSERAQLPTNSEINFWQTAMRILE